MVKMPKFTCFQRKNREPFVESKSSPAELPEKTSSKYSVYLTAENVAKVALIVLLFMMNPIAGCVGIYYGFKEATRVERDFSKMEAKLDKYNTVTKAFFAGGAFILSAAFAGIPLAFLIGTKMGVELSKSSLFSPKPA